MTPPTMRKEIVLSRSMASFIAVEVAPRRTLTGYVMGLVTIEPDSALIARSGEQHELRDLPVTPGASGAC